MSIQITAFHTCHLQSGKGQKTILNEVPYHCDTGPQWLGQGYYFWTDSDHYAHQWGCLKIDKPTGGRVFKYSNGYIITKFKIDIPLNELLDLVGNTTQQIYFFRQIRQYLENVIGKKVLDTKTVLDTPISKVIEHLKLRVIRSGNSDFFPYSAIKAADKPGDSLLVTFIEDGNEATVLPTRQQLCLFSDKKSLITSTEFHLQVSTYERTQNLKSGKYKL